LSCNRFAVSAAASVQLHFELESTNSNMTIDFAKRNRKLAIGNVPADLIAQKVGEYFSPP
jgi:hypothetical protein